MPYDLSEKSVQKAIKLLEFIEQNLKAGETRFIIPIAEPKPRAGFEQYKIPPEELQRAMDKAIAKCKLLIYQAIAASKHLGISPYKNWEGMFKYSPVKGGLEMSVKPGSYMDVSEDLLQELAPIKPPLAYTFDFNPDNIRGHILAINQKAKLVSRIVVRMREASLLDNGLNQLVNVIIDAGFTDRAREYDPRTNEAVFIFRKE